MSAGVIACVADIEEYPFIIIHQLHGFANLQRGPCLAGLMKDQHAQCRGQGRDQYPLFA